MYLGVCLQNVQVLLFSFFFSLFPFVISGNLGSWMMRLRRISFIVLWKFPKGFSYYTAVCSHFIVCKRSRSPASYGRVRAARAARYFNASTWLYRTFRTKHLSTTKMCPHHQGGAATQHQGRFGGTCPFRSQFHHMKREHGLCFQAKKICKIATTIKTVISLPMARRAKLGGSSKMLMNQSLIKYSSSTTTM
jgi:hypothetical protein